MSQLFKSISFPIRDAFYYRSVIVYQAGDEPDLGTVEDGTKCGDGKVRLFISSINHFKSFLPSLLPCFLPSLCIFATAYK